MKARLNVLGRKLEVVSISYYQDKVTDVEVTEGDGVFQTYYNEKSTTFREDALSINMEEALEFPDLEQKIVDERDKLIEHLEEIRKSENDTLTAFAIETMEGKSSGLPFNELTLVDSQREYRLMRERVQGFIDAVEEVKAYTEGYYSKVDDEAVE